MRHHRDPVARKCTPRGLTHGGDSLSFFFSVEGQLENARTEKSVSLNYVGCPQTDWLELAGSSSLGATQTFKHWICQ